MMSIFKKFFLFGFYSVLTFAFTSISIVYIKNLDPLMTVIKENSKDYEVDYVNAFINDNVIIPGISGIKVDVLESYSLMKRYGSFNKNLLVFKKFNPELSISNIYDKYVLGGNPNKKNISFVFRIEDGSYVKEIVLILKNKNITGTFFVSEELLKDKDFIQYLDMNNQDIELLDDSYDISLERINIYLNNYISKKISYCYSDNYNDLILDRCSNMKMHTIIPSINIYNNFYYEIKNNLDNGIIISISNNKKILDELSFIINYIRQNNYEIVSLKRLLEE